jgi:hypothetical protein
MTLGTYGLLLQTEFGFSDPSSASLRMSKDTSPLDSEKSLESWNQSVTKRRGEYSARLKSALLTRGSESSSWPTARTSDCQAASMQRVKAGPNGGKGYQLREAVVTQDAANWPTPATVQIQRTDMQKRIDYRASIGRKYVTGSLEEQMQQHGQAAPANPSTDGSRQGLWPTATVPNGGQTTLGRADKASKRQVRLEHVVEQWGTPTARDHKSGRGNEEREYKELTPMVERTQTGKLNPRWVETLMGLPVGWVMPSCKSPVTIEPTNCASSATESCLPPQSELLEF